jgi:S1-C subfamily serine protease
MMKKIWLIILPVLVVTLFATLAYTKPEPPDRPERRAMDEVFALAGSGYRLGVVLSEISPHLRDDLKITSGVMVESVIPDSAAEKAGLKEGDIILKLDGKEVDSQGDIRRTLRDLKDAKPITVDVLRDGKPVEITITPEKRTMELMRGFGQRTYIGIDLQELDADLSGYFQTKPGSGVLVTRVEPDSPAYQAGMKSGDVITEFNGKRITSADDLRDAVNNVEEGSSVNVSILRHGKEQKMVVKPEKQEMRHFKDMKEMQLPKLEGLSELTDTPEFRHSLDGLKDEMENLKKEMDQLREEMKTLRKSD